MIAIKEIFIIVILMSMFIGINIVALWIGRTIFNLLKLNNSRLNHNILDGIIGEPLLFFYCLFT